MRQDIEWFETNGISIRHNQSTETYRVVYERGCEESLTTILILAIEAVTELQPDELPPIHKFVNPEAVDRLFEPADAEDRRTVGYLSIQYAGFLVTIHADGVIVFRPLPNS
jgi:hypothetical protein